MVLLTALGLVVAGMIIGILTGVLSAVVPSLAGIFSILTAGVMILLWLFCGRG